MKARINRAQVKLLVSLPVVFSMIVLADLGDVVRRAAREAKDMFDHLGEDIKIGE